MCGEHPYTGNEDTVAWGSSPHVRGTRHFGQVDALLPGIIPACAGNTSAPCRARPSARDHPRMCGEHRGEAPPRGVDLGSSPQVRGTPSGTLPTAHGTGIIPACAGNTVQTDAYIGSDGDHPRMCGEHSGAPNCMATRMGSSPHVRGTRMTELPLHRLHGIIPACAGNTERPAEPCAGGGDHPRMCGEQQMID